MDKQNGSNGVERGSAVVSKTGSDPSFISLDDSFRFPLESFRVPRCYYNDLDYVLIPEGLIRDRVKSMADKINETVGDAPLAALCVLKGGYRFFTALTDELSEARRTYRHPMTVEFIRLQSYANTESKGQVEIIGANPLSDLKGQHVLVVEDLVDTGLTMSKMVSLLREQELASVKVACLLHKRVVNRSSTGYRPDFSGFEIADNFIVGFGLDYNQKFRDLNHICVMNATGVQRHKSVCD